MTILGFDGNPYTKHKTVSWWIEAQIVLEKCAVFCMSTLVSEAGA